MGTSKKTVKNTSAPTPHLIKQNASGIGFIAKIDGTPQRHIVEDTLTALTNLTHQGARDANGKTGNGAGILFAMPTEFIKHVFGELPPSFAVGMFFLPHDQELASRCESVIEDILLQEGFTPLTWRYPPVNPIILGQSAQESMPNIRQLLIDCKGRDGTTKELSLYIARRRIEKRLIASNIVSSTTFHIASLSGNTLIYKGIIPGANFGQFYTDLAEKEFASSFAVFHELFDTEKPQTWAETQPFRYSTRSGSIVSIHANRTHIQQKELLVTSPKLGKKLPAVLPILTELTSENGHFDNVLEFFYQNDISLTEATMMMMPEPFSKGFFMNESRKAFYEYHSALMEPWDGAAITLFTDGVKQLGATLDKNAFHSCHYTVTRDGVIILSSQAGILPIPPEEIRIKERLTPRQMLVLDLEKKRLLSDMEVKLTVSQNKPYDRWVQEQSISIAQCGVSENKTPTPPTNTLELYKLFLYTAEEVSHILIPMASSGQEPIGSMGADTFFTPFGQQQPLLFSYFKQRFAQITTPALDPLRESLNMSLTTYLGAKKDILNRVAENFARVRLPHPLLLPAEIKSLQNTQNPVVNCQTISATFHYKKPRSVKDMATMLQKGLEKLYSNAENALAQGAGILHISYSTLDENNIAIPTLLATSALHQHLLKNNLRHKCSIIIESPEPRTTTHIAQLIAFGANAVCPNLALATISQLALEKEVPYTSAYPVPPLIKTEHLSSDQAVHNYVMAIKKGLLKVLARLGISNINSFDAQDAYEAIGLEQSLCTEYFPVQHTSLEGVNFETLAATMFTKHHEVFYPNLTLDFIPHITEIKSVKNQIIQSISWVEEAIKHFQAAARNNDATAFRNFISFKDAHETTFFTIRQLISVKQLPTGSIDITQVDSAETILQHICGSAISLGAISPEAHEAITNAFNELGMYSNCGEGGESYEMLPLAGKNTQLSQIKQVASGRFGVTIEYLTNASEIQIKLAQGAKPGEGGFLPNNKVTSEIAEARKTVGGFSIVAPPTQHDIYSIEDLEQLIFDVKQANPQALISVKIAAEHGIGEQACAIVKAGADCILISGSDSGTGAASYTTMNDVGVPWEISLQESHAALLKAGLRQRVRLEVEGRIVTGKDVIIAALLGAERVALGTPLLIALGCCMQKTCHTNSCPAGIATQNPRLRLKFAGKSEHIKNYLILLAENIRELMAFVGVTSFHHLIGKNECMESLIHKTKPEENISENKKKQDVTLYPMDTLPQIETLLHHPKSMSDIPLFEAPPLHQIPYSFHEDTELVQDLLQLLPSIKQASENPKDCRGILLGYEGTITCKDRAIGTRLSGEMAQRKLTLPDDFVQIRLKGSAGQSLGAFLNKGLLIHVEGEANDFVGKGLSGGTIIVTPPKESRFIASEQNIIGNSALYGATSGAAYFYGKAGDRFAIRNSGAMAVTEGIGDHGCEYMSGGIVVILGSIGHNFASGMVGGEAYVYDPTDSLQLFCNFDYVTIQSVHIPKDIVYLKSAIEQYAKCTKSSKAELILLNWEDSLPSFFKISPVSFTTAMNRLRDAEMRQSNTLAVTEETYLYKNENSKQEQKKKYSNY